MDPFPDLNEMSDQELDAAIAGLEQHEHDISLRRRMLHGRIDLLRPVLVARLEELVIAGGVQPVDADPVVEGRKLYDGTGAEDVLDDDLGPIPDADALSTEELREAIRQLERVEDDVSLQRRMIQGKLDILRAERERRSRGGPSIGPDDLGAILGGGS
ncbi:MAG: hypothetical protein ACRC50_07230 [Gaiella sp.]